MILYFGMGLDGVMWFCCDDLFGIINGIDEDVWNLVIDFEVKIYKIVKGKIKV